MVERDGGGRRTRRRLDGFCFSSAIYLWIPPSRYPWRRWNAKGEHEAHEEEEEERRRLSKERGETALSLYPNFPRKEVSGNRCRGSRPTSIELASSLHRSKPIPQISFPSSISVKSCICVYIYIYIKWNLDSRIDS